MALYHGIISDEELKKYEGEFISWRRDFHENPDLSGQEQRTAARVSELLTEFGVDHQVILDGTSVVGIIKGGKPGPTIGLRADMDALPIKECTGLPYASKNEGVMHACGHDIHTTVLLGVAKVLSRKTHLLSGNVKLFFQPNEERDGGAKRMIAAGVLENPHVDYVLGMHIDAFNPAGTLGIKYGIMYAANDTLDITVHGKGAHGAHPEHGIDSIAIAAEIITNLQMIVSRLTTPLTSVVCTIGTIEGGSVLNQIADRTRFTGIMRTLNEENREKVKTAIKNIAEKTAEMYGATVDVIIKSGYDVLVNDDEVTALMEKSCREALGEGNVYVEEFPEISSEDFSYFTLERPGCFMHLGCGSHDPESVNELHNAYFRPDEDCILAGVKAQINNVLTLMERGLPQEKN